MAQQAPVAPLIGVQVGSPIVDRTMQVSRCVGLAQMLPVRCAVGGGLDRSTSLDQDSLLPPAATGGGS